VVIENRNGLVVAAQATAATGTAEREAALALARGRHGTLGGDKNYDTRDFVQKCRKLGLTPQVAQKESSALAGRTTRHPGYAISPARSSRAAEDTRSMGCRRKRTRHCTVRLEPGDQVTLGDHGASTDARMGWRF